MEKVIKENVDVPVNPDEVMLKGSIFYTTNTPSKAPWILNCPGLLLHRGNYLNNFFSENFARAGYYVLTCDYRAHGETAKETGNKWMKEFPKIFTDIPQEISWIIEKQSDRLLEGKIALFGRSLGGALVLTHGYKDPRVKKIIALCTRWDYTTYKIKFPDDWIKIISARYFLKDDPLNNERVLIAHCKDDERIPFHNMISIKNQLGLRDENIIIYETGGHDFNDHHDNIVQEALNFLKNI